MNAARPARPVSPAPAPQAPAGVGQPGGPASAAARAIDIVVMRWWHITEITELEARVFGEEAWSQELFWSELAQASARHYLAAVQSGRRVEDERRHDGAHPPHDAGRVVGYAGLATNADEAFVQTIGVDAGYRRAGVATRLLVALLRHARLVGARSCGLEVRTDNHPARALYGRLGFVDIGLRRGYYQPSGADAYVMRARPIDTPGYAALLDEVEAGASR